MESVLQLIEEHWSMSTEFRLLLVVSHCHREDYLIRTKGHMAQNYNWMLHIRPLSST